MIFLIAILIFSAFFVATHIFVQQSVLTGKRYQETFTESAESNMADMFIFIEPQKLLIINISLIIVTFIFMMIATGKLIIALLVAFAIGYSPRFLWKFLREKRNNQFLVELPDALNSITSMLKAGANLNTSIETLVSESKGPINQEFGVFLQETRMGIEFNDALDNFMHRMPLPELELVISGMKINREIGGSLADVLYRLADTLRRKMEMEGKINALTAQGKAQGYVMTFLPIGVGFALYKMEPEAMSKLFTHWIGWIVCFVFCLGISIGYFFIKKIVTIDV